MMRFFKLKKYKVLKLAETLHMKAQFNDANYCIRHSSLKKNHTYSNNLINDAVLF